MKTIILSIGLASLFSNPIRTNTIEVVPVKTTAAKEVVSVYQTPKSSGSITVNSSNTKELDFYLFDVEGTMIYKSQLKQNKKQLIEGLPKGTYIYNAFKNDEKIEGGNIILR